MHPSEKLFKKLQQLELKALGVVPVKKQIQGTSFFPGGVGLWVDRHGKLPQFPIGGVMVLGHDFHSEAGYEKSLKAGGESETLPTWQNLLKLLRRVPISEKQCFFTNCYMGLRQGSGTTGMFPGASDCEFKKDCQNFLLDQLAAQQPKLIITLGNHVPLFLALMSPQLCLWNSHKTFPKRDLARISLLQRVSFTGSAAPPCTVVSIIHPSLRHANIRHRTWKSTKGDEAELEILRQAWKDSQIGAQ